MKIYVWLLSIVFLFVLNACGIDSCGDNQVLYEGACQLLDTEDAQGYYLFKEGEDIRRYRMDMPKHITNDTPILFVLHGLNSSALIIEKETDFSDLSLIEDFILVYPEAEMIGNNRLWNVEESLDGSNDLNFILHLMDYIIESTSSENMYLIGHSNGGFMTYKLACEYPERFEGIVSVSSSMLIKSNQTCSPNDPIDVLHIHGTKDDIIPISGLNSSNTEYLFSSVADVLAIWKQVNHTSEKSIIENDLYIEEKYYSLDNNYSVQFLEVFDQEHMWMRDGSLYQDEDSISDVSQYISEWILDRKKVNFDR
jgi:polyhydroxybutyrate depolymerase